jgi:hypothetical protein
MEVFVASALGHGITTEADTLSDLREMVKDAVQCHFHDAEQTPKIIRLHFVRPAERSAGKNAPHSAESPTRSLDRRRLSF